MPDRLADYLKTIDITVNATRQQKIPADAIISFHPWYKLAKRKGGRPVAASRDSNSLRKAREVSKGVGGKGAK